MTNSIKYFSGQTEVRDMHYGGKNSAFLTAVKAVRIDSYSRMIGHPLSGPDASMPITRVIEYKKNPSLHKCDARCLNAKGRSCECSCGGANHGASN